MGDLRIQPYVAKGAQGPLQARPGAEIRAAGNSQYSVRLEVRGKVVFVSEEGLRALQAAGIGLKQGRAGLQVQESDRSTLRLLGTPEGLSKLASAHHRAVLKPTSLLQRNDLSSGAAPYNMYELNTWIAHENMSDQRFKTGQESKLILAIKDRVEADPQRRGLTLDDVLAISGALNQGDVTRTLLTAHNAFRQLSRGKDFDAERFPALKQDIGFFKEYLDGSSANIDERDADVSDEWYHLFTTATVAFVGSKKGYIDIFKEGFSRGETHLVADFATGFGQATGSTALLDAVGEQLMGVKAAGLKGYEPSEFRAEMIGAKLGAFISDHVD